VQLVDPVTGVLSKAKVVTGVDDHSRYCVMARSSSDKTRLIIPDLTRADMGT